MSWQETAELVFAIRDCYCAGRVTAIVQKDGPALKAFTGAFIDLVSGDAHQLVVCEVDIGRGISRLDSDILPTGRGLRSPPARF